MAERILVAVDGGESSAAAMAWAIDRAMHVPSRLDIIAVEDLGWSPPGDAAAGYRTAYEQALFRALQQAENTPHLRTQVVTTLARGIPAEEIVRVSAGADLVVLGADRPRRLAGVFHGTLAIRLAASVCVPLVVVPSDWSHGGGGVVVGVALDSSDDAALAFAAQEAMRRGCALDLLHAISLPRAISVGEFVSPGQLDAVVEARKSLVQRVADDLGFAYPSLRAKAVVEQGVAAQVLAEAARVAELLVVGTHGRSAFGGLLIGSVSHDVLLNVESPVVVVPPTRPARQDGV